MELGFGDGSSVVSYTTVQSEIKHTYTKTGTYKVVLIATNGECNVRDSVAVYVLLKQNPVLTSTQTEVCNNTELNTIISQLEANPAYNYNYNYDYGINKIEYADGSAFNGSFYTPDNSWRNNFHLNLRSLDAGKKDIRVIIRSNYFDCTDTTNFIPVKIKGPVACFEVTLDNICFKSPVTFKDTSGGTNNVAIEKWEWSYGDGKVETLTKGGTVEHKI